MGRAFRLVTETSTEPAAGAVSPTPERAQAEAVSSSAATTTRKARSTCLRGLSRFQDAARPTRAPVHNCNCVPRKHGRHGTTRNQEDQPPPSLCDGWSVNFQVRNNNNENNGITTLTGSLRAC